ncbi:OB-fold domain-containing protein [Aurantimonas sp. C2-5-R2]|uniref:Zn-ribbon domain-containing OB-fold protein n=1 Tax=Aurantimonas sp. C2-5-R2 TaxID=3113713 RepID=UPI002F9492BC
MSTQATIPTPIGGLYHDEMWASIKCERFELQQCTECSAFRYPPGPACPHCLSLKFICSPVSGKAEILSWVIFHKSYLESYPAPYNVIAVRLKEGPTMVSNLVGPLPSGSWIGRAVDLVYDKVADGTILPRFRLSDEDVGVL